MEKMINFDEMKMYMILRL